ncbi:DUF2752 domain-containing protein [Microlunatus speluncae]|uniref:DUF2752 domain-containing protein n=1 Tax=Microlunatus speluncae TaxID=2594267 RepID=UPI0012668127|nr:DUF2752 domain-containing protein [Microlunatus speluncae]
MVGRRGDAGGDSAPAPGATGAVRTGAIPGATAGLVTSFRAGSGLKYLAGFFGGGVALSAIYAVSGQGLPCPLRLLTGWECPLCGGTRLGSALLHGDLAGAFGYNPVVFIGLIVLTGFGVLWIVEALGGPRVRPPARIAAVLRTMTPTRWLIVGLVLSLIYVLARNLL